VAGDNDVAVPWSPVWREISELWSGFSPVMSSVDSMTIWRPERFGFGRCDNPSAPEVSEPSAANGVPRSNAPSTLRSKATKRAPRVRRNASQLRGFFNGAAVLRSGFLR
jgi:hypothetical protein